MSHYGGTFMIMNSSSTEPFPRTTSAASRVDSTKLVSLLALAAGAAAMPQTTNADIIFTDLSSSPVTVGYSGVAQYDFILPGNAGFKIDRRQDTGNTVEASGSVRSSHRRTLNVYQSRGSVKFNAINYLVVPHAKGDVWQGQSTANGPAIGVARRTQFNGAHTVSSYLPATYSDHKYLAFEFSDSTEGGAIRYGWAEILLTNGNLDTTTGPNVTIYGYAYDDTGAFIAAGATSIPEPSSAAFLALGALIVGAKGLRAWRRKETPTPGL
jgi:hypothetical protein